MKAILFLAILGAVVALVAWKVRKEQAEAAVARRKALQQRKKKYNEALSQDDQVIWPVIVTPLGGKQATEAGEAAEEPTMTSIEFEPADAKSAQQGGSA
jgi:hypothetical protein